MNPCLTRCLDCIFVEETPKRLLCRSGYFDVKINDGILLVPMDFDCVDFTRKRENNDKEQKEKS